MSTLQVEPDRDTSDALTSLAVARGTAPADLVAEIVARYVKIYELREDGHRAQLGLDAPDSLDALMGRYDGDRMNDIDSTVYGRRGDPLDAIVGSVNIDPVDDIDEGIYGR